MAAGANGWAAQRLLGRISVQRDYDGTPMVSDLMADEFYLTLAKALRKHDRGHIQYAQVLGERGAMRRGRTAARHRFRRAIGAGE